MNYNYTCVDNKCNNCITTDMLVKNVRKLQQLEQARFRWTSLDAIVVGMDFDCGIEGGAINCSTNQAPGLWASTWAKLNKAVPDPTTLREWRTFSI